MADPTTAPLHPPVIEASPAAEGASPGRGRDWPLLGGVAFAGAVLGTAITYLLLNVLPSQMPVAPEIRSQGEAVVVLEAEIARLNEQTKRTQMSLDATIVQLDIGLSEAKNALAEPLPPPDLAPLKAEIAALEKKIAAQVAPGIVANELVALKDRLGKAESQAAAAEAALKTLRIELANTRAPTLADPTTKLSVLLALFDAAFMTGAPFEAEAKVLAALHPDWTLPPPLAAAATGGLPPPDAVKRQFAALLPEIIAATPRRSDDWATSALEAARVALALRPADEMDGAGAEAVVTRLEAAMARGDFAGAEALIGQLPEPMRKAAAAVVPPLAAHAAAAAFLTTLRAEALKILAAP